MSNHYEENDLELTEFGEYLLHRSLVPENRARFYVLWMRKFFWFRQRCADEPWAAQFEGFLEYLGKEGRIQDWQLQQAEHAVRLFHQNFRDGSTPSGSPSVNVGDDGSFRPAAAVVAMRHALRLRHYAYRTGKTYLSWVGRFFAYLREVAGGDGATLVVTSQGIKDFLAWLVTRRDVSASTHCCTVLPRICC